MAVEEFSEANVGNTEGYGVGPRAVFCARASAALWYTASVGELGRWLLLAAPGSEPRTRAGGGLPVPEPFALAMAWGFEGRHAAWRGVYVVVRAKG